MDFISFLETLSPTDWQVKVSEKWTVKDVVAHMVGWEREGALTFKKSWDSGVKPWFMTTDKYEDFNNKIIEEYKNYETNRLIEEWQKWQSNLDAQVQEIGEEKVNERYKEFDWVFDNEDDNHYEHHLKQIKHVLNK